MNTIHEPVIAEEAIERDDSITEEAKRALRRKARYYEQAFLNAAGEGTQSHSMVTALIMDSIGNVRDDVKAISTSMHACQSKQDKRINKVWLAVLSLTLILCTDMVAGPQLAEKLIALMLKIVM